MEISREELERVLNNWNDYITNISKIMGYQNIEDMPKDMDIIVIRAVLEDRLNQPTVAKDAINDHIPEPSGVIATVQPDWESIAEEQNKFIECQTGNSGRGENDREEFYCEFCGEHNLDWGKISHKDNCRYRLIISKYKSMKGEK